MPFPRKEFKPLPEGKMRRYVHSPFTLAHDETTNVSVSEDGKITIRQHEVNDKEAYDEVEISASLIFKLAAMLTSTRKVHIVDKDR